ncbi:MAG: PorP/SprF family type IX secretion system membrane protein [Bacteroidales bacterium]|nr:PorP/SprF family type IX secretion system membrane protein [Bacteroidales bacterium]
MKLIGNIAVNLNLAKIATLVICLGLLMNIRGQDPMFTHHMFNRAVINPAYAGSSELMEISMLARNQWWGWSGVAPRYLNGSVTLPFNLFGMSHGAGLVFNNDKFGVNNDIGAKLIYAFQRKTAISEGTLGFGLSAGFNSSSFDGAALNGGNDPLVPSQKLTGMTIFDMGVGVYYKTEKIYFGLSSSHIFTGVRDYRVALGKDVLPLRPQYYAMAGYSYQLPNPMLVIIPSFLIQSDGKMTSLSFNTNLLYNNRVWGGVSYNAGSAVSALFGLELMPGIKFGISYDYDTSILNKVSNGSVEVFVLYGFKLKKEKIPQKYKSLRYL